MNKELYDVTDLYEAVKINDELKEENHNLCKELERYKNITDKTVEYVKRLTNGKTSRIDTWENVEFVLETILSILKGE